MFPYHFAIAGISCVWMHVICGELNLSFFSKKKLIPLLYLISFLPLCLIIIFIQCTQNMYELCGFHATGVELVNVNIILFVLFGYTKYANVLWWVNNLKKSTGWTTKQYQIFSQRNEWGKIAIESLQAKIPLIFYPSLGWIIRLVIKFYVNILCPLTFFLFYGGFGLDANVCRYSLLIESCDGSTFLANSFCFFLF